MRNIFSIFLAGRKPPSDTEIFSNLDKSTFLFLSVINDFKNNTNQIFEIEEMSEQELELTYRYVVDASLGNFSHLERQNLRSELLKIIPPEFVQLRNDINDETYLPAPTPQRFVGWIQDLLNQAFPPNVYISDEQFGILFQYIASAFRQGNAASSSNELTRFEDSLATLLFLGAHRGLEEAYAAVGTRASINRHMSLILMLSLILGVKHSRDNNLKSND